MREIIGHINYDAAVGFALLWLSITGFYLLYLVANICVNAFTCFMNRPPKEREIFTVLGAHGNITAFTDNGQVVKIDSDCICNDCEKTGGYLQIVQLDVAQYREDNPGKSLVDDEIWLVSIGYWDGYGHYEPAIIEMDLRDHPNEQ